MWRGPAGNGGDGAGSMGQLSATCTASDTATASAAAAPNKPGAISADRPPELIPRSTSAGAGDGLMLIDYFSTDGKLGVLG